MPHEFDWWTLIDKRAALKEQFPPLSKVRHERPGCRTDLARQAAFRSEAETRRVREAKARWDASVAENQAKADRREARRRNAEYRAYQEARSA